MKEPVPYIVHESILARMERTIKRLWILCIIMFLSLVISNAAWIYYESQMETVYTSTEQDVTQRNGNGNNTFVGGDMYDGAND